ncbi:hypothetical protein TRIUR3_09576 [Triticum urartu]|uniref:Uncharacterized protein n=1 Tax=Triticum urartu TaxID=4572 RepID=M7Z916_TRIUA|nr:hypothetical protein TRIUR3_09576 [Triticum urartu]
MSEAEAPLITEEAAERGLASSGSRRLSDGAGGQGSRKYRRRSDALAHGDRYQKAAALVDLRHPYTKGLETASPIFSCKEIRAEDGVGIPEDVLNDTRFGRAMSFYFVYLRLDWLWSLNLFALILLNFLEKPLWCRKDALQACDQRDLYFLGQLPYFSKTESLIYEGLTLVILVMDIFCPLSYEGLNIFWRSTTNKLKILLLFILACDILVFAFSSQPFRLAPYIRVVFLIMTIRELRMCAITLAGLIGTYLNVLMFVLFTTSNNPDVWVPAYKISRWYSLFFIVYVLLGVYFLTNLILAVIYDSFKEQFAKQLVQVDSIRKNILQKAFDLIDTNNRGYLDREQCISLLNELNKYRKLKPCGCIDRKKSLYKTFSWEAIHDPVDQGLERHTRGLLEP